MSEAPSLTSYLVFNTVAKRGNLSAAARDLLISQPAVSRSLSKLEDGLDVKLFVRNSRGVRLTEEGEILYGHTRSAFDSLESAERSLKRASVLGPVHLKVGVSPTLCKLLLTPKLRDFGTKHPNLKPEITLGFSSRIFDDVENGLLDVGLIYRPLSVHRLEYMELGRISDTFVVSPDYLLKISNDPEHDSAPHIFSQSVLLLPEEGSGTRKFIDSFLEMHGLFPLSVTEVRSDELLLELARSGAGIAPLPKEYVRNDIESGTLTELRLSEEELQRSVGLVYKKTSLQYRSLNLFLEAYGAC